MTSDKTENAYKNAPYEPEPYEPLAEKLASGEKVKCSICHKGIYQPFNPKAKVNHGYTCDYCGSHINLDPVVEVK